MCYLGHQNITASSIFGLFDRSKQIQPVLGKLIVGRCATNRARIPFSLQLAAPICVCDASVHRNHTSASTTPCAVITAVCLKLFNIKSCLFSRLLQPIQSVALCVGHWESVDASKNASEISDSECMSTNSHTVNS